MTTCSHWLGEFYTSYAVTYMFKNITYGTFLFFGSMTVLGAIYMYLFVPETNGVPLEDMDVLFESKGLAPQKMKAYQAAKANEVNHLKTETEDKRLGSVSTA
ncbi:hypothetical protein BJX70DRAFT_402278 [Aspergillus crustosus]